MTQLQIYDTVTVTEDDNYWSLNVRSYVGFIGGFHCAIQYNGGGGGG